jgi:broad specificity phosphatase PhoE
VATRQPRTPPPISKGLVKAEGKARFGAAFAMWQKDAAAFEIDGHAPVRELWHRGSVAWQHILTEAGAVRDGGGEGRASCALVVAHNAVNQALLGTALGLPPRFFRRLLQSNGATSVLDFEPPQGPGAPMRVTVDRLNQARRAQGEDGGGHARRRRPCSHSPPCPPQCPPPRSHPRQSPGSPFKSDGAGRPSASRVIIVRHAATEGSSDGVLLGSSDEALSPLGVVQAGKVAEFMMDLQVGGLGRGAGVGCLRGCAAGERLTSSQRSATCQKLPAADPPTPPHPTPPPVPDRHAADQPRAPLHRDGGAHRGAAGGAALWRRAGGGALGPRPHPHAARAAQPGRRPVAGPAGRRGERAGGGDGGSRHA